MIVLRVLLLAGVLFGYWLVLSGIYLPWLVIAGGVVATGVVIFAMAKGIVDREGFPFGQLGRGLVYWPWLLWQIVLSALKVSRIILSPGLPVSPTLVRVDTKQDSAVGVTTYANSITLTPGTISIEVSERSRFIWVHALTKDGASGFDDDPMNDKVAWMDGASP